jgi:hypothetical protein
MKGVQLILLVINERSTADFCWRLMKGVQLILLELNERSKTDFVGN